MTTPIFSRFPSANALHFTAWNTRYRRTALSEIHIGTWNKQRDGAHKMKGEKVSDRRIKRTRKLLQDALVGLILEKGYDKVTVQNVIDRANVGRSTFYAHFQDIDDLLVSQFDEMKEELDKYLEDQVVLAENPWKLTLVIFQHVQKRHQLYAALIGERGGNVVLADIDKYFSALIRKHLTLQESFGDHAAATSEVVTHYIVSSLTALLIWWLDRDLPYSAEQMNDIFRELTVHGVESVLRWDLEPIRKCE